MPEVCTCGAKLPEDARFCHKCGKPQREEPVIAELEAEYRLDVTVAAPPPPLPTLPEQPSRIGFQNRFAVRAALAASASALFGILFVSQISQPLGFVVLGFGGFFAVFIYMRRTGQRLSVMSGARLGWLCGVFVFVAATALIAFMALMLTDPAMVASLREQMHSRGIPAEMVDQLIQAFRTPSSIFSIVTMSFLTLTSLPALGGAIGAKLLGRH